MEQVNNCLIDQKEGVKIMIEEPKEEMQDRQQQECPQCHSANVVRLFDGKTRSLICDDCGHNWKPLKEER